MSLVERQNDALLKIFAQPGVAQQIRMGLNPQLLNMDEIPPAVPGPVPAPVFAKKRKRKPPEDLSKYDFRLEDFDSDDDLFNLRRKPLRKKRKRASPKKKRKPTTRKGAKPAWWPKSDEEEQKMQRPPAPEPPRKRRKVPKPNRQTQLR